MYDQYLTTNSIFGRYSTMLLVFLFFAVRALSFILVGHNIIQGVIVFCLILLLGILYFINPHYAWYLVIGEIFLGGSGHFLELNGLAIRTLFIAVFVFLWAAEKIGKRYLLKSLKIDRDLVILLSIFLVFVALATFVGLKNQNEIKAIMPALVPFVFFLLIFPSYQLFRNTRSQERLIRLVIVFILGTALFSLGVFTFYSTGLGSLQDNFYHWYRDVNAGKITDLGQGFYRVVEAGHLLLIPILLFICSLIMRGEKHNKMWRIILVLTIIPLMLNFSRTYFLAFLLGLVILLYKHKLKRWLVISFSTMLLMLMVFSGISFLSSGGKTLGLELFGIRVVSLVRPQVEISSATRMMILPAIVDLIKVHPLLGSGLGTPVSFTNTLTYEEITTTEFDWGYLQLWVELGIFGLLSFLSIIIFAVLKLVQQIKSYQDYYEPDVGFLAGLVAMFFMTIFSPALYHVFGIFFLMLILATSVKPADAIGTTVTLLYRIFNRLKEPVEQIKNSP